MALTLYQTQLNNLLHNQSGTLYTSTELNTYINSARKQIASEGACIRGLLSFSTVASQIVYTFGSISVGSGNGYGSVLAVRQLYSTSPVAGRPWEWFAQFYLNSTTTGSAITAWAQFLPGDKGSLYVYPIPTGVQSLSVDAVILPIDLVDDTTVEALPYPWTDAIKYYAAYLAFAGVSRNADSDRMYLLYTKHMQRARDVAVPSQLPRNFPVSSQLSGVPTNTQVLSLSGGQNAQ